MPTNYEKYMLPVEPADPNAEYMTVQETAWLFKCHVSTIRKRVKELQVGGRVGRRIMLDRAERDAIFEASRAAGAPRRVPAQRRRKATPKRAVTPKAGPTRAAA